MIFGSPSGGTNDPAIACIYYYVLSLVLSKASFLTTLANTVSMSWIVLYSSSVIDTLDEDPGKIGCSGTGTSLYYGMMPSSYEEAFV